MTFTITAGVAARALEVSLRVDDGETVAVLGPNGSGKSTLLAVIAGLLRPSSGRAELDGRVLFDYGRTVADDGRPHGGGAAGRSAGAAGPSTPFQRTAAQWVPPYDRKIALLAQEPLLFPHLSVLENVAFGPRSAGAGRADARQTARHWLVEVEALELASRRPGELSGGQAQRIALARALAAEPDLLLLDEPMAALDIAVAPLLRKLLKRVLAGRRSIIVTHDVVDALVLADRVVVLEGGKIVEEGPTRRVLERPQSRFAAGLAGLNQVTGTVTGHGIITASGMSITGPPDGAAVLGEAGVAVFRPSDVSVFRDPVHGSPRNAFEVSISDLEPHGDQIRIRAGGLAADVTLSAAAELDLTAGSVAYFVVKSAAVRVFPAKVFPVKAH
ncbi:sulfate/molybdate ABC transporter ATP-binding protein [Arthrobacter sp. A5]|uniref:sulfate/molybdate ABC transporter ATP-binding protein n=1 Tax=Arthrobacter sp. A5 TaxID=576926 RepID=UPI003DA8C44F